MRKLLMEFIGTMFLVLAIAFTGNPLAIGIMLMVMIYMGGHVSGAHYNPAVSIAIWMRGKMEAKELPGYIAAQIAGAFTASFIYYLIADTTFAPAPGAGVVLWKSIFVETLFTFALVSVILNVATTKKLEGNYIYGLAIGLTVTASAFAVGSISGGAFNPAVGTGPILFNAIVAGGTISNLVIYMIGPLMGAVLAALVFKYLNADEFINN